MKQRAFKTQPHFYLICTLFFSLLYSVVNASEIAIFPVRLKLLPGEKITSFSLTNRSQTPMVVQLGVMKWTHDHGQDIYEETKKVIATPPIAKILPNETQIVRAGLLLPADSIYGETYRVIVKELPHAASGSQTGIQTLLELRLPLLIDPVVKQKPDFVYSVKRTGAKGFEVSVENRGKSHFQISRIALGHKEGKLPFADKTVSDYLIPHQRKTWAIETSNVFVGDYVQVLITTDQSDTSEMIPLSTTEK